MVNAGRVACIFTPFLLSTAALVCIILVFIGGTSQHNKTLGSFYFFEADLTNFTSTGLANLLGDTSGNGTVVSGALNAAKQALNLKDYYTVYLWNYCAWNGDDLYAYCSPKQAKFYFNPIEVWGLNGTDVEPFLSKDLTDGIKAYKTAAGWMYILYVIALVATIVVLVVGITAMFSRWGSFFTTGFATLASVFIIAATVLAQILFLALRTAFNDEFKDYGIHGSIGMPIFRAAWLAVLFSLGAGFFWLLSVCCCSGRSPYVTGRGENRRVKVEKTPYTYERVGSPYLGPRDSQAVPLSNLNYGNHQQQGSGATAYEPFRPQQV